MAIKMVLVTTESVTAHYYQWHFSH